MIFPVALLFEGKRPMQVFVISGLVEAVSREEAVGIGHAMADATMKIDDDCQKLVGVTVGSNTIFSANSLPQGTAKA